MTGKSSLLPDSMQIDRLQKAADDARQQLESKENVVKTLSRDGSKLDKERCADLSGSQDIKQYMLMFCLGRIPWSVCQQTVSYGLRQTSQQSQQQSYHYWTHCVQGLV